MLSEQRYEGKALLGVCRAWTHPSPDRHAAMASALHTIAADLTTSTGLLSEWWGPPPAEYLAAKIAA